MVPSPYTVGVADALRQLADSSDTRSIQSRARGMQEWRGLVVTHCCPDSIVLVVVIFDVAATYVLSATPSGLASPRSRVLG